MVRFQSLILSFLILSSLAASSLSWAQAPQCLDLFSAKPNLTFLKQMDDLLHQPEMTYLKIYQSREYAEILAQVTDRLQKHGVEFERLMNGEFVDAIAIIPSNKSEMNRLAESLFKEDGTHIRIPLTENVYASSMGHVYLTEASSGQRLSIYNISLYQFFELGWGSRSRFHRHEMRHRNLKQKVLKRVNEGKDSLITTGSVSLVNDKMFPEQATLKAEVLHSDGILRNHEYTFKLPFYRKFISYEEMWTYLKDIQVIARHASNKLKNSKKVDAALVETMIDLMLNIEAALMINYRLTVIKTWTPIQFYSTSIGRSGQILFKDNKSFESSFFDITDHSFYFQGLQLGHMVLQNPEGVRAYVSMPLEKAGQSTYIQLQEKTLQRVGVAGQLAKTAAILYFETYARIHKANPAIFSNDPAVRATVKPQDLQRTAFELDQFLVHLSKYAQLLNTFND